MFNDWKPLENPSPIKGWLVDWYVPSFQAIGDSSAKPAVERSDRAWVVLAYLVTLIFCLEACIRISYLLSLSLCFEHQVARSKEIPTCGPTMSYWRLTQNFTFRSPRGRLPSLKCLHLWVPWYFQKRERLVPLQKEIPTRLIVPHAKLPNYCTSITAVTFKKQA